MRVAIRVDASLRMGSGHVMRCLVLADALRTRGARCLFVCRPQHGDLLATIRERGHDAIELMVASGANRASLPVTGQATTDVRLVGCDWQTDAADSIAALAATGPFDWLVVDHYGIDARWEAMLRPQARRLMVIDDLADRRHDCDVLLDQNLGRSDADYVALTPAGATRLAGPRFALVGPAFAAARPDSLKRRACGAMHHLLISMGGSDPFDGTRRVLSTLADCTLLANARVSVVMGLQAPSLPAVRAQAQALPCPTEVHTGLSAPAMAALMASADLAIGGAGGTAWERCCVGLPGLLVVLAENQSAGAMALARANAAVVVGDVDDVATRLLPALCTLAQADTLVLASAAAGAVTDGLGVDRVIGAMGC